MGVYILSDDFIKYCENEEVVYWGVCDLIVCYDSFLCGCGVGDEFFVEVVEEVEDFVVDVCVCMMMLQNLLIVKFFEYVYIDVYLFVDVQCDWFIVYEVLFDDGVVGGVV